MDWDFSPDEVVKGEVDYDLRSFRRDLLQETSLNMGGDMAPAKMQDCFDLLYDLCYWLATGRPFDAFEVAEDAPLDRGFLESVRGHLEPNVLMLGAILQRMIMDGVATGLPVEQAVAAAAERHAATVACSPLDSA